MLDSNNSKDYSWRHLSYHNFYQVVDVVVEDIQSLVWVATGKAKRRLKGNQLEKLREATNFMLTWSFSAQPIK